MAAEQPPWRFGLGLYAWGGRTAYELRVLLGEGGVRAVVCVCRRVVRRCAPPPEHRELSVCVVASMVV